MLLVVIDVMGNHNHRACYEFVLFLRIFMKIGSNDEFCWYDVLVQVLYGFKCLFMSINVWTNIGNKIWALEIKNWDFGVKMEFFPRATCHSSPW